ncbi:MAG TPA: hypothetical protein VGM80_11380 [Gaiellaceae bacterium]|jgi:hypothetical protein
MTRSETARIAVVGLMALVLIPAASSARAAPNPCSLLTDAQVTKALGYKVQSHSAGGTALARSCTWSGPAMGYSQTSPTLIVQASLGSRARFVRAVARETPLQGFGGNAYVAMDGALIDAWGNGVTLLFSFDEGATTPKTTIALIRLALAHTR